MINKSQLAAIVAVLGALFLIEQRIALRRRTRPLLGRLIVNASLSSAALLTAGALVRPSTAATLRWSSEQPFGLIHIAPLPAAVKFAAAFLLLDLSFYWWHVANHRLPWLWRFHNVHHIDPDLDVSTAFRFHFGEVAMSTAFRIVQVAAIGPTPAMFAAYELAFQANTMFHHSNVRLPIGVEQLLNRVLVTPRMHGIHHSQVRSETNSNYSVVFSWWDRLHRTLGLNVPQESIVIGVPGYSRPEDNGLLNALLHPFRRQREYWERVLN